MTKRVPKIVEPTPVGSVARLQEAASVHKKPFVTTKLRPPSNKAKLIDRPRLMEILKHSLAYKLILIHGPAGFGKTTLAAQWHDRLAAENTMVAWLAVDSTDNDLERFLGYIIEAIRHVEPNIGSGLAEVLEANPGNASEYVLGALINEFELYDGEFVLFLDDFHLIHEPKIHESLEFLLLHIPSNLHVIVTSRSLSGMPLARLKVQNELLEINATDLRFDYEESSAFLSDAKALELNTDDLMGLWRTTEGWVAALQLASISLRRSDDRERLLQWASGITSDIGGYLVENVLTSLPEDLIEFMVKTSILGRLSEGLCNALTAREDSSNFLNILENQELFLLPIDVEREWFRYHHLFAKFLQRRLEKDYAKIIPALHRAASEWFSSHGQTDEALTHALVAGDVQRAVDLVEKDAMSLVQNSYMGSILNLVSRLPEYALCDRPGLQTAISWAHCLTHHPQEAREALTNVERVAAKEPAHIQRLLIGEANVIRACVGVYGDQIAGAEALVRPCLDDPSDYPPWVVGVAANILTYVHIHTFQLQKVAPMQTWVRKYQDRAQGLFSSVYGRCFTGIAAYWAGDLTVAEKHFQDALKLAHDSAGIQSPAARLAGSLLGQLKYEKNELEEAEQLLQESRALGFEGGVVDFYLATFIAASRLMIQKGNFAEASAILHEGETTAKLLGLDRLAMAVLSEQVRHYIMIGDTRAAARMLAAIPNDFAASILPTKGKEAQIADFLEVAKARIFCEEGCPEQAIAILRRQSQRSRDSGRKYQEIANNILLAIALNLAGESGEAEEILAHAVTEGVRRGIIRTFLDEGPRLIAMLEVMRERARRHQISLGTLPEFSESANLLITTSRHPDHGLSPLVATRLNPSDPNDIANRKLAFDDSLKSREMDILRLLDQGRANKEIARVLNISVDTVKWYLKSIFSKLCVTSRGQAIAEARRLRLLDEWQ